MGTNLQRAAPRKWIRIKNPIAQAVRREADPAVQKAREAAQRTQMQNLLKTGGGICTAFDSFFRKFGVYPSDLNDVRLPEFTPNNELFDQLAKDSGLPMLSL